jgi:Ca-activated chloride channel family protein
MKTFIIKTIVGVLALLATACDSNNQTQGEYEEIQRESTSLSSWPVQGIDHALPLRRGMVIAFDCSSSMDGSIGQAKKAVEVYVQNLSPDVEVGIVTFGGNVKKLSDIRQWSGQQEFSEKMKGVYAGGGTPLSQATILSYNMLAQWSVQQKGYCEYHLVVVTDGDATDSIEQLSSNVKTIVDSTPVRIFTIGFNIGQNHALNMPGKTRYVSADNVGELSKGLQEVLAEKEF